MTVIFRTTTVSVSEIRLKLLQSTSQHSTIRQSQWENYGTVTIGFGAQGPALAPTVGQDTVLATFSRGGMEGAFEEQGAEMEKTCWRLHLSRAVMACTCRGEETERGNKLTASVMGHPLLQLLALTGSKGWASGRELADLQPEVRPCPRRGPARGLSATPVENDALAAHFRRWTPCCSEQVATSSYACYIQMQRLPALANSFLLPLTQNGG